MENATAREMENATAREIVSRIVASAPSGEAINEIDVLKWRTTPFIKGLAATVQPEDKKPLMSLMEEAAWPVANLAVSLLRVYKDDPNVRSLYLRIWHDHSRPLEARFCVMYPLLDYPDLPSALHQEFFDAIMQNLDFHNQFAVTYFVTPGDVLSEAKKRIIDKQYPNSKRWIYLVNALASPDSSEVKKFIDPYQNDSDPFIANVAKTLSSHVMA